MLHTLMNMLN